MKATLVWSCPACEFNNPLDIEQCKWCWGPRPHKQCFCGEELIKRTRNTTKYCNCCCREFEEERNNFYWCNKRKTCRFRVLIACVYRVCSQCYSSMNDFNDFSGDEFTFNKLNDTMKIIQIGIHGAQNAEELKKYMFGVNKSFNKGLIAKLKETKFGETTYFKEVNTHYNAFYDDTMNKIRDLVDLNELKLDQSIFVKHENMKNIDKEQTEKMNQIALKWMNLNDEIKDSDNGQNVDCYHKKLCPAKERLSFVNNIFKEFFDTNLKSDFFEIFEHSLADYSAVDLLNDFQHFQSFHFEEVSECDCEIEQFIQTEREKEEKSNLDSLSNENRNILDIAIKAHQFIMHRKIEKNKKENEQNKVRPYKWQKWRENDKKYKKNKFVQEMIESEETENENEQTTNDLMDELIKNGMKQANAQNFMHHLDVQQYDTDAIRFDLEQRGMFNKMNQMNLFNVLGQNRYFIKIIKNHLKIKGNDNDKIPVFSFGEKNTFCSWQYYKESGYFIIPKFVNLKEELLNNSICAMDIELFDRQLLKAHIFASSGKGKRIKTKDSSLDNKKFEVSPFCPISVAHILCILIYCNCTKVQYKFKKYGTRKSKNEQTLDELKQLNAEINHWYSLLFECVWFFGSETTENDIFYTGLSIFLVFDSFAPKFRAPISTTVDLNIATNFSKGVGVILKLRQGSGRPAYYFDVEWLSNFEYEQERLFFYVAVGRLCIEDVQTWHIGKKFGNEDCIKAMALFSSLFAGNYLLNLCNKNNQRLLCAFIQNFNANNNIKSNGQISIVKNQFSLFLEQIFSNLVHKMTEMIVIKQEFDKLDGSLKDELFVRPDKDSERSLFIEHLVKRNKKNIEFMDEFIWILNVEQINALKHGQKEQWIYSHSFYFDICYERNFDMWHEKIKFKVGLKNNSFDKYTAFKLEILESSNVVNGVFSICVDDIGYVDNALPFFNKSSGQYQAIFCFEEKCLEKILDLLALRVAVKFRIRSHQ